VERKVPSLKEANLYNWVESAIALSMSAFVNICIVSGFIQNPQEKHRFLFHSFLKSVPTVAAANFYPNPHNNFSQNYSSPNLDDTSHLLRNFLGKTASVVFGIALLASGQSSTLTGTYAGQFVMEVLPCFNLFFVLFLFTIDCELFRGSLS
jgi:manganese transport protein